MDQSRRKNLEKWKKKEIRPTIESRNEIRSRAAIYHRSSGREGWAAWVLHRSERSCELLE